MEEVIKERIERANRLLTNEKGVFKRLKIKDVLRSDYEELGLKNEAKAISKEIVETSSKDLKEEEKQELSNMKRNAYDTMARCGDFEAFMIAMEWDRPIKNQFYLPRRRVLRKHGFVQAIQRLIDREIKMLVIEAPPGIGKSVLGEFAFCYQYVLNPERKSLMGGNANMLVTGFYQDILDFLSSPEYRFREIFPNFPKIENSAEFKMIYTDHKKREPNLMFVSIEVGATGIIHVDGMLYVDDLIKTAEQANNPDQCLKIRHAYTGMLQDRLVNAEVPILVIGTMWSINDHISYLKDAYSKEPWFENISVPCMNAEHTESNFMYDYGQAKTVEHWERLIRDDDEVIAQAKFFCIAIDREGKLFNTDEFTYFNTLPEREPDQIVAAVDVAFGGGDNYAMPIAYVYGRDVYIADVIYSKEETNVTKPRTVDKIFEHKISKVHFEANNGGDEVSIQVSDMCKKRHIICNITSSRVPTNKTKLDRILAVAQQIRGKDTNEDTYRLIYLARDKQNEEYRRFMSCVSRFSQDLKIQGKQEDDAPDALSNLITNVIGKTYYGKVTSTFSRSDYGF